MENSYIKDRVAELKIKSEIVQKAIDITSKLNEFLESEILIPHEDFGFAEFGGFMRRGQPHLKDKQQKVSADAFQRYAWPFLCGRLRDGKPNRFEWLLVYETPPGYRSSGEVRVGCMFDDDMINPISEIRQRPFYINTYTIGKKKGMLFSSIDKTISFLREYLPTLNYKKR